MAPCPRSHLYTLTLADMYHALYLLRSWHMLQEDHSYLLCPTRNPHLRLSLNNATPCHLKKMVHKNLFRKTASVNVVIVAMVAQVSVIRHLVVVEGRACSSRPVAAEMGTCLELETRIISRRLTHCRDTCRFLHVLPDGHVMGPGGRSNSPLQKPINGNIQASLEEKLANLSITEVSQFISLPIAPYIFTCTLLTRRAHSGKSR